MRGLLAIASETLTTKHSWRVRTSIIALGATVAIGWLAGRARAGGIPAANPMRFTGTVAEQGVPVNGARDITINLYDDATAGTLLCSTVSAQTAVVQGRFTVPLVDTCTKYLQGDALSSTANRSDTWVEVQVAAVSFGRQKVGAVPYAVTAGTVNGVVTSTAILPTSAADGVLGRGSAGASIYNDSTAGSLILTGNGTSGTKKITLNDSVQIQNDLTAAGKVTAPNVDVGTHLTSAGAPVAIFGGMWCTGSGGESNVATKVNPITGAATCPAGFPAPIDLFSTGDLATCSSSCVGSGIHCFYCAKW
jgi:hypothetical protein